MSIHDKLIHALTQYDIKQSKRKFHNPNFLPIAFERVDEVMAHIERGASVRQALLAGFNDRILDVCLKAVGEKPFTKEEMYGQGMVYNPSKSGFRLLKEGETILSTDEYLDDSKGWIPANCIGEQAPDPRYTAHRTYRRAL